MDASRAALSLCLVYTTEVVLVNKANGVCGHVSVPGLDEWAVAE